MNNENLKIVLDWLYKLRWWMIVVALLAAAYLSGVGPVELINLIKELPEVILQ